MMIASNRLSPEVHAQHGLVPTFPRHDVASFPRQAKATATLALVLACGLADSFAAQYRSHVQIEPSEAVAFGDFNGDGSTDIATSDGQFGDFVRLYVNDGNTLFGNRPIETQSAGFPSSVRSVDMDQDGLDDLVFFRSGDGPRVLYGDVSGQFEGRAIPGIGPFADLMDVDGDGDLDVVFPRNFGIRTWINAGGRQFVQGPRTDLSDPVPGDMLAADWNQDGLLDLVAYRDTDPPTVQLLISAGDGSFVEGFSQEAPGTHSLSDFSVLDMTGDRLPDVSMLTTSKELLVLPSLGNGALGSPLLVTLPPGGFRRVADLDRDGLQDFVTRLGPDVYVYTSLPGGGFHVPAVIVVEADNHDSNVVRVADLNGNGMSDLVFELLRGVNDAIMGLEFVHIGPAGINAPIASHRISTLDRLSVFAGDPISFTAGYSDPNDTIITLTAGDIPAGATLMPPPPVLAFDAETRFDWTTEMEDVGTTSFDLRGVDTEGLESVEQVRIHVRARPVLPSYALTTVDPMSTIGSAVLGEVSGDGIRDLLTAGPGASFLTFLGTGGGAFSPPFSTPIPDGLARQVRVADLSGEGIPDAVVSALFGNISVFLGNGAGEYMAPVELDAPGVLGFELVDVNGDGRLDVLAATDSVYYFENLGGGQFQAPVLSAIGHGTDRLVVEDWNQDGVPDLASLISGILVTPTVTVMAGSSSGTYSVLRTFPLAGRPRDLSSGDFTANGAADLILTFPNEIVILQGLGDGTFGGVRMVSIPEDTREAYVADVNVDGYQDLVTLRPTARRVDIRAGRSDGSLASPASLPFVSGAASLRIDDVNNDGQVDFVAGAGDEIGFLLSVPGPVPVGASCGEVLMASVGVPITADIIFDHPAGLPITLTAAGLPNGAQLNPPLPLTGVPVSTRLTWTPQNEDVGTEVVTFFAVDSAGNEATCILTIEAAECFLVFGIGSGNEAYTQGGATFQTSLSGIFAAFPVTMDDYPSFAIGHHLQGDLVGGQAGSPLRRHFTAQVVMHNPLVFPQNPDQWTEAMRVRLRPDGTVLSHDIAPPNGMQLETSVSGDLGNRKLAFPFTIDALE